MKAREWELEGDGDQHNTWIRAKRLNGDGGWGDLLLSEPVIVIEKSAYQKAVDALREIAKDRYEANPWTVVPTAAAKKAEEVLKELGEL